MRFGFVRSAFLSSRVYSDSYSKASCISWNAEFIRLVRQIYLASAHKCYQINRFRPLHIHRNAEFVQPNY
jgi:hypothetical protein